MAGPFLAKVTGQGQIIIPQALREALGLRDGDSVLLYPQGEGVRLERVAVLPEPPCEESGSRGAARGRSGERGRGRWGGGPAGEGTPRLVLDTNVLIAALGWDGPERRLLRACMTGELQLRISMPLLDELLRVLTHPKLRFPADDQRALVQDLLRSADLVAAVPDIVALRAEPDYRAVLACAIATGADAIVTSEAHLLALARFEGIPILSATSALRSLLPDPPQAPEAGGAG
jgi:putative PIN family toxin of toxin-antitoxin system